MEVEYRLSARCNMKSYESIKQIEDAVKNGYKVVFIDHPPHNAITASNIDVLNDLRKQLYDFYAIKEPDLNTAEYFSRLYPIECPKPIPMDTKVWLKYNPYLNLIWNPNEKVAYLKLEGTDG
jgi:hypothetical protein